MGRQPRPWFTTPENPTQAVREAYLATNNLTQIAGFLETQKPGKA
jgi:hypothetical protein